jgi:type I restriction enzyme, S subunit
MKGWHNCTIGDLGRVVTGSTPPAKHPEWFGAVSPFITPSDMTSGSRRARAERSLSEEGVNRLRSRLLPAGCTCFVCIGSIGKLCLTDSAAITNQQINAVVPAEGVDGRFVYYLLKHNAARIASVAGGAATPIINKSAFAAMPVRVPDAQSQAKVGGLLGALDDLIENNRRRIELLEQMAQEIYREWFVRFRYPGHEDVALVNSPLGPIPDGWEVRRLSDLGTLVRGRAYRKHELADSGGVPFVNLKCMMRGGGFARTGLKRYTGKHTVEQRVSDGDIVLAVTDLTQGREILARATLVPRLSESFGVISLDVARLVPHNIDDRLGLFFTLRCSDFSDRVKEFANGSTVLHLSPTHINDGLLVWPSKDLRRNFVDLVEPMVGQTLDLNDAVDQLASIRDLLLPKLVSGQIDVSKLDLDAVVGSVA